MKRIMIYLFTVSLFLSSCNLLGFLGTPYGVTGRFTLSTNRTALPDTTVSNTNYYSFIHITDTHYFQGTNVHLGALPAHFNTNDAFIVITGDLVNTGIESEYQGYISHLSNIGLPFYSAIGNHDIWNGGWSQYPVYIGPSVYSFVAGTTRFICLDSANGTLGAPQTDWLIDQLAGRTEELCIVMTHYNLLSPTMMETAQWADMEEVYMLMYIFELYNVDLVLMGHTHIADDQTINGVRYVVGEELKNNSTEQKQFNRVVISNQQIRIQHLDL